MSRASSPSDVSLTLPVILTTSSQSIASRRLRSPVNQDNALAMLRRLQTLEEKIALLEGDNQALKTALENRQSLIQRIAASASDERKSLNEEVTSLREKNRALEAEVHRLRVVVKHHGLESEVKFVPKKPASPAGSRVGSPSTTKRDQLFQLPKAPFGSSTSVRHSPSNS